MSQKLVILWLNVGEQALEIDDLHRVTLDCTPRPSVRAALEGVADGWLLHEDALVVDLDLPPGELLNRL